MARSEWESAAGRTAANLYNKRLDDIRREELVGYARSFVPGEDGESQTEHLAGGLPLLAAGESRRRSEAVVYANAITAREIARLVTKVQWRIHYEAEVEAQRRHAELIEAIAGRDAARHAFETLESMERACDAAGRGFS